MTARDLGVAVVGFGWMGQVHARAWARLLQHYPDSPLNGAGVRGTVRPGERVPPVAGQVPVGSGGEPLFALFADRDEAVDAIPGAFKSLVDSEIRPALHPGTLALVRPDGYLACSAHRPEAIGAYLSRIAAPAAEQPRHA